VPRASVRTHKPHDSESCLGTRDKRSTVDIEESRSISMSLPR
jgi:hypothetical protein